MDTIPLPLDSVRMTRTYWDRALRDHQRRRSAFSERPPRGTAVQMTAMESDRSILSTARSF